MPEFQSKQLFRTADELNQPEVALVNGKIPEWLNGSIIRTGPGKFDFDKNFSVNHYMDGYAMLSKFDIKGDSVKFEKKFLDSESYKRAMVAQKPVIREYGTMAYPDPAKSMFSRLIPSLLPEFTDNGNLSLFTLGKQVFASGELNFFHEVNPSTLKCCDRHDTNKVFGLNTASCHPLTDEDGTTYNVGGSFITGLKYNIVKIPAPASNQTAKDLMKKSKILCTIPSSSTTSISFTHSFGLTKNYIVLIEQPYVMTVSKLLGGVMSKGDSVKDWLEWRPELKNKFIIIDKATGKVHKTEFVSADPFFFLHIINCYEENNQIVLDLTVFPNPNVLVQSMELPCIRAGDRRNEDLPTGQRFVIPLVDIKNVPENVDLVAVKSGATAIRQDNKIILTPEIVTEAGLELPAINRKYLGKKINYYYASGTNSKGHFENALCKVDVNRKETFLWRESEHYFPAEPIFIPNPKATSEDDGVLVACVCDDRAGMNDFLLFLDAKNLKELGRAKFKADFPPAIHGVFLSQ